MRGLKCVSVINSRVQREVGRFLSHFFEGEAVIYLRDVTEEVEGTVRGREARTEKELETVVDTIGEGLGIIEAVEVGRFGRAKVMLREKPTPRARWHPSRKVRPSVQQIWDTSCSKT